MKDKYFFIEPKKAKELLIQIREMKFAKRGVDRYVYLIGEYAILKASKIKLRNVVTRDDNLVYFDELIKTLMHLKEQGVSVVPILGYSLDQDSKNGSGYLFQQRAKGEELYDDAVMKEFYVCRPYLTYLSSDLDGKEYILSRTNFVSRIPQKHFDKYIRDIIILLENDILVDFYGKSNFFYDDIAGFQFIDLDSHTDYKYGLTEHKPDSKEIVAYYGFTPCHLAIGTKVLSHLALDENALTMISDQERQQLVLNNRSIFKKCKIAMLNNGISEDQLSNSLADIKIFGL